MLKKGRIEGSWGWRALKITVFSVVAFGLFACARSVQCPEYNPEQDSITVEFQDGSHLVGNPAPLTFKTANSTVALDPKQFNLISVSPIEGQTTANLISGDKLTGALPNPLKMSTAFGVVSIPLYSVLEIYGFIDLKRGLVAYWKFDGDGQDSVGNHNLSMATGRQDPAYGSGGGASYKEGLIGQSSSQKGNNSMFQMSSADDMDFYKDFTFSAWLYREQSIYDNDALLDDGVLYVAKRDASPWNSKMGVYVNSGSDSANLELIDNSPLGQPPLHTWFHVVVFRKGNILGIKVNNQGTATVDVSGIRLRRRPLTFLGQQIAGYPWQGRIDEIGFWNRALQPAELTALYNNGKGLRPL